MHRLFSVFVFFVLVCPVFAQEIAEPRSGVKFAAKEGDTALLGAGLRTRTIAKVKIYAIALYVADTAIAGPLKHKPVSPDFYHELVNGDFHRKIVMKFVRDVSADQIRDALRDALKGVSSNTETWINYFGETHSGQEYAISWTPGVGLETRVAGSDKTVINDKVLASAIFSIWLGDKPIQDDIKKDLVSRAPDLLK
jgi:Chalcone isomerase-like